MFCLDDPRELRLYGETQESAASILLIELVECNNSTTVCKEPTEVADYLETKRFVLVSDRESYNNEKYDSDPVEVDVRIDYIRPFTHKKSEFISMKISTQQIAADDRLFNPGWFGEVERTIYALERNDFEMDAEANVKFGLMIFAQKNGTLSSR